MSNQLIHQARSTYRAVLRELPRRPLSRPSPLHLRIREAFRTPSVQQQQQQQQQQENLPAETEELLQERELRVSEANQLAQYARAQRTYATLLERYNPGIRLDEEEKLRLTARRVGLEMPVLGQGEGKGHDKSGKK